MKVTHTLTNRGLWPVEVAPWALTMFRKGGYGVKEKVAPARWHTLRVEFKGNHFKVVFDDKHLFDVEDSAFAEAGNVGVWTKADSVTLFDDFSWGNGK